MKTLNLRILTAVGLVLAAGLSACNTSDDEAQESTSAEDLLTLNERLAAMDTDVSQGAKGDDVHAVQEYLAKYGYLPNEKLASEYPNWRPIVNSEPKAGVYDETTTKAVRALQVNFGVADTGVVDAATRAVLTQHRCGHPDGISSSDPTNKFSHLGSKWNKTNITWRLLNTDDVSLESATKAALMAFRAWSGETGLNFAQTTNTTTADIEIQFGKIDGPGEILAYTRSPTDGDMVIDIDEKWSVGLITASDSFDLQTVMTHELGHALGLHHSNLQTSVMFPSTRIGSRKLFLQDDDKVGISTLYDNWKPLPGSAKDIGVGVGSNNETYTWIIGTNNVVGANFGIYQWDGSTWVSTDGSAARIAVAPTGVPWIVNSYGEIYRRTTNSATSGGWQLMPGSAKDIGIGANGDVWIIGTDAFDSTNFRIHKWNNANSTWSTIDGAATRIAVDSAGRPWVVNSDGWIYRRTTSGTWEGLPGRAKDIGIAKGNYAWITGYDWGIFAWNEQEETLDDKGEIAVPGRKGWVQVVGDATQIAVGAYGEPWVVNSAGQIFRSFN